MLKYVYRFILLLFCVLSVEAWASSEITALLHKANDPVLGNPKGEITIVEFFDYQCSHCIDMAPVMHDVINNNKEVRLVLKEFPIRGALSDYAARAALAANKQGKYADFSYALFVNQPLSEENILMLASNSGLNVEQLKKDMKDIAIKNQLASNINLARELKLTGTPAFFIGKTDATSLDNLQFFLGAMRQSELQTAIDKVKQH